MTRYHTTFLSVICMIGSSQSAFANDLALAAILQQDGPYIEIPAGFEIPITSPSTEDIIQMADLDGDPTVTTPEETAMIAILMQVMIGTPITQ